MIKKIFNELIKKAIYCLYYRFEKKRKEQIKSNWSPSKQKEGFEKMQKLKARLPWSVRDVLIRMENTKNPLPRIYKD